MPQRTDLFDIGRLGLTSGEGRRLDLHVGIAPFEYGGSRYAVVPELVPVRLDISRTTANGWAMRLRFDATWTARACAASSTATPTFSVDSYEVHQPGAGDGAALALHAATSSTSRPGRATRSRSRCRPSSPAGRTAPACARAAARTSTRTRTTPTRRARPALVQALRAEVRLRSAILPRRHGRP